MYDAGGEDYGWSGYPDERSHGGMGYLGEVSAVPPTPGYPTSGDPRQHAVNSPQQIRIDASNFRKLDYPVPDTGNAYDPLFRAAVTSFQTQTGLAVDGLIGPGTRAALVSAVENIAPPGPSPLPPAPIPDIPPPPIPMPPQVVPQVVPGPGPVPVPQPVVAEEKDNTMLYLGLGIGGLALAAGAYYLLSD